MTYTSEQIEIAKRNYNEMLVIRTVESYDPQYIGYAAAEQRCEYHNRIVNEILSGNKETEKTWKLFFLNQQVKLDRKFAASQAKKASNKAASADILAPIKEAKRLVEFGKWLNTKGNPFRSQNFSKKYTQEAVNTFLSL